MLEALVSVFCAGEHVVSVASTQDEKYTETEDQKRPEKKTACMQIAGYLRKCLGEKVGMDSVCDAYWSSRTEQIIKLLVKT